VRLNNASFAPAELANAISTVTVTELSDWRDSKLSRVGVIGLVHGNLSAERIDHIEALVSKRLRLAEVTVVEPTIAEINGVQSQQVLVDHDDSATVIYLQGRDTSLAEQARFGFASQLIRSPYFTALRTERQLGYVVAATNARLYKTPGLVFVVQSPVASNAEVLAATREFAAGFVDTLTAMSAAEFTATKSGYLSQLLEKDKNQYGRSQRYWRDLLLDITSFDGREQIAAQVEALDQPTMVTTMRELTTALNDNYLLVTSPGKFKSVAYGGSESSNILP
jgi:secreted Zn-dependent insulinase-like peptidase